MISTNETLNSHLRPYCRTSTCKQLQQLVPFPDQQYNEHILVHCLLKLPIRVRKQLSVIHFLRNLDQNLLPVNRKITTAKLYDHNKLLIKEQLVGNKIAPRSMKVRIQQTFLCLSAYIDNIQLNDLSMRILSMRQKYKITVNF